MRIVITESGLDIFFLVLVWFGILEGVEIHQIRTFKQIQNV
jgi:hypothetical protein